METAKACEAAGANVVTHQLDITRAESVKALFAALPSLTAMIHCAGIMEDALLAMSRQSVVDRMLDTNFRATLQLCQMAQRNMLRQRKGCIVLLGSKVASEGSVGQSVYAATKGAIHALTKSLSKEFGPAGIRVNCVAPGFIETDLTRHYDEAKRETIVQNTALRRLGSADDVANLIAFVCSEEASFLTGQIIEIDGGLTL